MPINPFVRPLPSRPSVANPPPTANVGTGGPVLTGGNRAQALRAIAADVHARTARLEHLRAVGHFVQEELKNAQHTGSSRLDWLAQQMKKIEL